MGLVSYIKKKIKEANETVEEIKRKREAEEKAKRIDALKRDFAYIDEVSNELGIERQTMLMYLIYIKFSDFDVQLATMKEYVMRLSNIGNRLSDVDNRIEHLGSIIRDLNSNMYCIPDLREDIDSLRSSISHSNFGNKTWEY